MKPIEPEYSRLFAKCEALPPDGFLYTTFGGMNYYTISREEDYFVLREYKTKWSFQKHGKELAARIFNSPEGLRGTVLSNPRMYAESQFGNLEFLDNWRNFVNAFEPGELVIDQQENETNYYYRKIE